MNDIKDAFTTSIEIEIRAQVVAQLVEWSLPSGDPQFESHHWHNLTYYQLYCPYRKDGPYRKNLKYNKGS